eukprot:4470641-Alexandrium_andersonii.AAC.1
MPTLLTRTSKIWSYHHRRVLAGLEKLEVMGLPIFSPPIPGGSSAASSSASPYVPGVQAMALSGGADDQELSAVAGNAMVNIVVGCLLLFAGMCKEFNEYDMESDMAELWSQETLLPEGAAPPPA